LKLDWRATALEARRFTICEEGEGSEGWRGEGISNLTRAESFVCDTPEPPDLVGQVLRRGDHQTHRQGFDEFRW
jgi:hypothetical protein